MSGAARGGVSNQLRIVGGKWRSRRLRFVDAEGLRPTPDRIRETLFNWVQFEIVGAYCLDAFAGSGALGFEALSRGAAEVVMIERHPPQFQVLQVAAAELDATGARLLQGDAVQLLQGDKSWLPDGGFEGVFLDPPFHKEWLPAICECLLQPGFLRVGAFVYVESESGWDELGLPPSLQLKKTAKAGLVQAFLARYQPDEVK